MLPGHLPIARKDCDERRDQRGFTVRLLEDRDMGVPLGEAKLLAITCRKHEGDAVPQQMIGDRKAVGLPDSDVQDRQGGSAGSYPFKGVRHRRRDHDILNADPRQQGDSIHSRLPANRFRSLAGMTRRK